MFRALDEEIKRLETPRHQLRASEFKRKEIDQRILELTSLVGDGTPPPSSWFDKMADVALALKRLAPRLDSLLRRLEARDLVEARRLWKKIDWGSIRDLTSHIDGLHVTGLADVIVEWTAGDEKNESLLDRVEAAIDTLDEIRDALDGVNRQRRYWEQLVDLRSERLAMANVVSEETP